MCSAVSPYDYIVVYRIESLISRLRLSSSTLEALNSFLNERQERQQRFEQLKAGAEKEHEQRQRTITMEDFEEDWQQSQAGFPPTPRESAATDSHSSFGMTPTPQKLSRRRCSRELQKRR
jgi:hypothetical protein